MSDSINLMNEQAKAREKIKVFNPKIVVSTNNPDKPYYSIIYYDVEKKIWCQGFASYCLKFVQQWFHSELEEVEMDLEVVTRCKHCTIKKAVPHKDGIVWRCPHRTGDIKMEGFCESGVRGNGNNDRSVY